MLSGFRAALLAPELLSASRLSPTAFTRQRTLTFPRLLAMMLSGMCASVQSELDRLFATLTGEIGRRAHARRLRHLRNRTPAEHRAAGS